MRDPKSIESAIGLAYLACISRNIKRHLQLENENCIDWLRNNVLSVRHEAKKRQPTENRPLSGMEDWPVIKEDLKCIYVSTFNF